MFKKGPDIDKKKLLQKASDVKKDSLTRLKHFKTLIDHLELNELPLLFQSHFSFIYHTFIDTFSTFDCNSKQRRDDLECILFMLEKILIYNPELIKKRWQFYSITFVMQKLLHLNNTWRLRQEGVRLFVLWYQILCDETNAELQLMFASLVPKLIPQRAPSPTPNLPLQQQQSHQHSASSHQAPPQLPIKLCSIDPLVPMSANDQLPNDDISFYLDSLLQFMVTQTTKPCWSSPSDARKNQELGFSFLLSMFKKIYLPNLFPDFNPNLTTANISSPTKSHYTNHSIHQYMDEAGDSIRQSPLRAKIINDDQQTRLATPDPTKRDPLQINLKQSNFSNIAPISHTTSDQEIQISLSVYQAIVIRWLTRIMRQDMIPGQDELIKPGSSVERKDAISRDPSSGQLLDHEFSYDEKNSTTIFHNMETTSREMEVARRVAGTWPENIAMVHELFRRAFLNYYQPASMKRVVNVYKEWICNGGPTVNSSSSAATSPSRNPRLGYTSFSDLLQIFVLNSSNAFVTRVSNQSMLDEQVEMCKRIMNIYRFMVMKIYMNTSTWEQLLNAMLSITEHLFPPNPPEKKELTIGGRIAPAFFQTFIVSWIRANLYVHISSQMWNEFHRVMKNLIRWRELVEEWSTTMGSLTRVLVKHVYGLSLTDLPLDKPQDRRRRPKTMKSFSTVENTVDGNGKQTTQQGYQESPFGRPNANAPDEFVNKDQRSNSTRMQSTNLKQSPSNRGLSRSNSDGILSQKHTKIYHSALIYPDDTLAKQLRKIKSEYLLFETDICTAAGGRSSSPSHHDVLDATSLKDSNMIIENDHNMDSNISNRSSETSKSSGKKTSSTSSAEKCVLLGGSIRGWTNENSVIMWRRMLGLFGNINQIEDPDNHLVAMRCLAVILCDFIKTRENLGISVDNQCTPDQPALIPPYTYHVAWLLEATQLPRQFKESRLTAYKLLCYMSIRRHDIELSHQYYAAFYEALHRGLASPDPQVHASIIKNCPQLLTFELPGCTILVQGLIERSRSILLSGAKEMPVLSAPRDQAAQILGTILALHRPIKKLMVLKLGAGTAMSMVAPGDVKSKIFDTLLQCNMHPAALDSASKCKSLCSMTIHVYQELSDSYDSLDVEKLFDTLMTELQGSSNSSLFRINCDLLRLFADHGPSLAQSRPALVSSVIQILCQLIVRLSTNEDNKESVHCLLLCLEDWCIAVGKNYLVKPVGHLSADEDDEHLLKGLNESLITIVLRSLDNVIHDEQFVDDSSNKGTRGSMSTSKGSDAHSSGRQSHHGSNSDHGRDRTLAPEGLNQHQKTEMAGENENLKAIKLACKVSHRKLLTYLGHFPFRHVGAASLSCCVNEVNYLPEQGQLQENNDFKDASNIVLLVVNDSTIISLVGSASQRENGYNINKPIYMIVRNICGKYSWDATSLDLEIGAKDCDSSDSVLIDPELFQQDDGGRASMKYDSDFNDDGNSSSSMSSRSSMGRDYIGDLLNQLNSLVSGSTGSSSQNMYKKRNTAQSISNPRYKIAQAEESMVALLTNQRFQELNYCERSDDLDKIVLNIGQKFKSSAHDQQDDVTSGKQQLSTLEQSRRLIQHLGFMTWEKRSKVKSLAKSARLMRELKNLDGQSGRETHKIAVIYVANGQEDKNSILTNSSGSRAFEEFISGLGWEVNLASHLGFKGGLQTNKSTGETSPYYCNSTTEVMFHVSTRIPLNKPVDDESMNRKLRHLGNDEIHIVWSEHMRDYRRGIIPTEFGDVIIAIYPMLTFQNYFRVQILCKQDVPLFGPLYDNCIVHQTSLAQLVRATAINASRAKRLKLPYYQTHFEERSRLIETIVQNHGEKSSFEEFAMQLYKTNATGKQVLRNCANQQGAAACCS